MHQRRVTQERLLNNASTPAASDAAATAAGLPLSSGEDAAGSPPASAEGDAWKRHPRRQGGSEGAPQEKLGYQARFERPSVKEDLVNLYALRRRQFAVDSLDYTPKQILPSAALDYTLN